MVRGANTTRSTLNTTGKSTEDTGRSLAWLLLAIALTVHFIAFVLSAIAFFAPFWYVDLNSWYRVGLWGRCDNPDLVCIWFNERDYAWEKSIPEWHKAAQVIYAIGIAVLTLAFLTAIGNLIFRCCKTFFILPIIVGSAILVATLFELLAVIIFGAGAYRQYEVSLNSWVAHFEWAFYVAISALFICTAAGVLFIHAGIKYYNEMRGFEAYRA